MAQQHEKQIAEQAKMSELLIHKQNQNTTNTGDSVVEISHSIVSNRFGREQLMPILSKQLTEFIYAPNENRTIGVCFSRFEDLFIVDGAYLTAEDRCRLLIRKLSEPVYMQFADVI